MGNNEDIEKDIGEDGGEENIIKENINKDNDADAAEEHAGLEYAGEKTVQDLQQNICALQQEKEELTGLLQRIKADFDNFRKRTAAERENARAYALFDLISRLLPVIDNIDRALASAVKEAVPDSFAQGLTMIKKQIMQMLENEGVSCIEAENKCFDPQYHEAVMQTTEGEGEPNTVVEELQKGYVLKDRVLRPAMVKVFTGNGM